MDIKSLISERTKKYYCDLSVLDVGKELFELISKISFPFVARTVMFDTNHFIKTEESFSSSLTRKFGNEIKRLNKIDFSDVNNRIECYIGHIKDVLRMNFELIDQAFEHTVVETLGILLSNINDLDFSENKFKDSFHTDNCYKDLKFFLKYKNIPFEIQFHNYISEKMNLATHGIYEVARETNNKSISDKIFADKYKLYEMVNSPEFSINQIIEEVDKRHA